MFLLHQLMKLHGVKMYKIIAWMCNLGIFFIDMHDSKNLYHCLSNNITVSTAHVTSTFDFYQMQFHS
jgi:hypothetical protein